MSGTVIQKYCVVRKYARETLYLTIDNHKKNLGNA